MPPRTSPLPLNCILDADCHATVVMAHRGAGVDSVRVSGVDLPLGRFAPENTLAALRWAIAAGADAVEIDLQTTRDGHLVLLHDEDVARTTTGCGHVRQLTLARLRTLRFRGTRFLQSSDPPIATLEEALALCRGRINIVVDLKSADARRVAHQVRQHAMQRQVFLMPPSADLQRVQRLAPDMPLVARPGRSRRRLTRMLAELAPAVVQVPHAILERSILDEVHAAGAKVAVDGFHHDLCGYLSGSPAAYAPLLARRPDIVNVDRADLVLRLLRRWRE